MEAGQNEEGQAQLECRWEVEKQAGGELLELLFFTLVGCGRFAFRGKVVKDLRGR